MGFSQMEHRQKALHPLANEQTLENGAELRSSQGKIRTFWA